jgi:Domain of unknown function (DUF4185)
MKKMALLLAALALVGCGVRLDEPDAASSGAGAPPLAPACRLFEQGDIVRVAGPVRSLGLGDKSTLFVTGSVELTSGTVNNAGLIAAPGADAADCFAGAELLDHELLDPAALGPGQSYAARAPVAAGGKRYLYYDLYVPAPGEPFGVKRGGTGVAEWDDAARRFVPSSSLLFTGDRASYGGAALAEGDYVYVYGCTGGFPEAECSVARVPTDRVTDESAYEFYTGGGHFSADVDEAWAMVGAGDPLAVRYDEARARWLMVYAAPLGSTITMRSGLSPFGPWSQPIEAASCELPGGDAFCGSATILTGAPFAIGYSVDTFSAGAADANPHGYWSRMAMVAFPLGLP